MSRGRWTKGLLSVLYPIGLSAFRVGRRAEQARSEINHPTGGLQMVPRPTRLFAIGALAGAVILTAMGAAQAQTQLKVMRVSGPVQLLDLRGPAQKSVRQARSRGRASEHPELRGAAQRPRQGRPSDRARRGRQCGGDGRARQGQRRDRHRRRQRLQPHLRPARDQRLCRAARKDGRGGCPQYRVRVAAVQGAQGQWSQQGRLRRQAGWRNAGTAQGP